MDFPLELDPKIHKAARAANFSSAPSPFSVLRDGCTSLLDTTNGAVRSEHTYESNTDRQADTDRRSPRTADRVVWIRPQGAYSASSVLTQQPRSSFANEKKASLDLTETPPALDARSSSRSSPLLSSPPAAHRAHTCSSAQGKGEGNPFSLLSAERKSMSNFIGSGNLGMHAASTRPHAKNGQRKEKNYGYETLRYALSHQLKDYLHSAGDVHVLFDALGFDVKTEHAPPRTILHQHDQQEIQKRQSAVLVHKSTVTSSQYQSQRHMDPSQSKSHEPSQRAQLSSHKSSAASFSHTTDRSSTPTVVAVGRFSCRSYQKLETERLLLLFPEALYAFPSERIRVAFITDVTVHLRCSCPFPCVELKVLASLPQGVQKKKSVTVDELERRSSPRSNSRSSARSVQRNLSPAAGPPKRATEPPSRPSHQFAHKLSSGSGKKLERRLSDREVVAQLSRLELDQQQYYTRTVGIGSEVVVREFVAALSDLTRYSPIGLVMSVSDDHFDSSAGRIAPPTAAQIRDLRATSQQDHSHNGLANSSSLPPGTFSYSFSEADEVPAAPLLRVSYHETYDEARDFNSYTAASGRSLRDENVEISKTEGVSEKEGHGGYFGEKGRPESYQSTGSAQRTESSRETKASSEDPQARLDALRAKIARFRQGKGTSALHTSSSGTAADVTDSLKIKHSSVDYDEYMAALDETNSGPQPTKRRHGAEHDDNKKTSSMHPSSQVAASASSSATKKISNASIHVHPEGASVAQPKKQLLNPETALYTKVTSAEIKPATELADRMLRDMEGLMQEMDELLVLGTK